MTKINFVHHFMIVISIIMLILHPMMANSQNIISADPSDTFDSESIFINPAVIPFQHRQVTLGMKVYQLGFLKSQEFGIQTGYFSFSLPEAFSGLIDLGMTGQNFSVPLYDQTSFSLLIAKRTFERLSIGIKYNLFTKSYHQRYFDLVDQDDPVFAKGTLKMAHSIGAGIILFPWSTLSIGFSCDHLNRPDVSLFQDNFRQPLTYDFGFRYSWTYFSSSLYFNHVQSHWQLNWLFESRPSISTIFKIGFVQRAARFGAQFNLIDAVSLNYSFDYPFYEINQLSSGSHQISLMYDLDHRNRIKELQFTRYNKGRFPVFNLPSQFFVKIDTEELKIFTRKIVRSVDKKIPASALKNLTEIEVVLNDSTFNMQQLYEHGCLLSQSLYPSYSSAKYSQRYEQWLAENLLSKQIDSLRLIADLNSVQRATDLRDFLVAQVPFYDRYIDIKPMENIPLTKRIETQTLHHLTKERCYILKPESVSFHISSIKMRKYRETWKLVICDCSNTEIKTFIGKGRVPEDICWNWRDNDGILIKPDIHYYYFQWKDKAGQLHKTQPKMFSVIKISRTLNIDIRSQPDHKNDPARVVEIKLAN
ncbi:MAG: type IX secretion system membrane protein PorP/SprF [bacterium]|nr:MAG: type IX secretion system membrane protein PorP/SprF [bacterium]